VAVTYCPLLEEIWWGNSSVLETGLQELLAASLFYDLSGEVSRQFQFKHALVRDAAYESLLRTRRREIHSRVADGLEARGGAPELLAVHYREAGRVHEAIGSYGLAGESARDRYAHVEAIDHLNAGITLLKTMEESEEGLCQELALQTTLGSASTSANGYSAPETVQATHRARELCRSLGDEERLLTVMTGFARTELARDFDASVVASQELLDAATARNVGPSVVMARYLLGAAELWCGDQRESRAHSEECIRLYDTEDALAPEFHCMTHPSSGAHCNLGWSLWLQGFPEQANAKASRGLAIAESVGLPSASYMHQRSLPSWRTSGRTLPQFDAAPARAATGIETVGVRMDSSRTPIRRMGAVRIRRRSKWTDFYAARHLFRPNQGGCGCALSVLACTRSRCVVSTRRRRAGFVTR
jgi:hypothetical protein